MRRSSEHTHTVNQYHTHKLKLTSTDRAMYGDLVLDHNTNSTVWKYAPGVYNPPPANNVTFVQVNMANNDWMRYVIGKNGRVFKAMTKRFRDVRYIWYMEDNPMIEIWSDTRDSGIECATNIMDRMDMIEQQQLDMLDHAKREAHWNSIFPKLEI